jgi:environmental stress-induced protein Ves
VNDATVVFRHADYVSMPWRNGAGTTREIAREPAAGVAFDWRLSLATVAASGPFSAYAGYTRIVALVTGAGFELRVAGEAAARLVEPGDYRVFRGEAATACALLDGPCTDLSLMVRAPGEVPSVVRLTLTDAPARIKIDAPRVAIFSLCGAVRCGLDDAEAPAAGRAAPGGWRLGELDTLLIRTGEGTLTLRRAGPLPATALALGWQAGSSDPPQP